ncbi:hypothetical protein SAMN02746095_03229 [Acidocella aminolytica 101 = DSM 11237]|uniref:Uncharacterized protein n=1 Tax=Acidocella aminolytica 101 = DSM 11237 TaxID=1120923 RepID=A0A0D6PHW7_9PROT|nr:hypothetical protein Aam_091_022 [Acidocella aminolytica 101 = DSM 11237]GBQ33586.1 hypothetical protein AA11237_0506 [Acidocella aminolytica 101 = DSM 11237]SHF43064.1 hypothetical protein SAMN02746095_03229 [Acidocella aminolytica 101 = DSM 11237]
MIFRKSKPESPNIRHIGIESEMNLTPSTAIGRAVLTAFQFAFSHYLDASVVHPQMQSACTHAARERH